MLPGPRPGQLGCVRTTGPWVSKVIQWVTHSPVNHVVVAVTDTHGIEAAPHGAGWVLLAKYPTARWTDLPLTDAQVAQVTDRARALLGTPYGWADCLAAGLWSLGLRVGWVNKVVARVDTMDCSQLGAECLAAAGVQLVPGQPAYTLSPGDVLLVADGFVTPK